MTRAMKRLVFVLLLGGVLLGASSARIDVPQAHSANATIGIRAIAKGLRSADYLTAAPGEPNTLYIVQQSGIVRVVSNGKLRSTPFLDIEDRVQLAGEMGLLSIAFDPDYARNHVVYAAFNDREQDTAINVARFVSDGATVDPSSMSVLVRVPHPDSNAHNGGQLAFGSDGKLYVGIGDGGYADGIRATKPDPNGNSQNLQVLLGKIFRLDPAAPSIRPEIVAYGLRNPWRFSFEPANGDLIVGDVGWNSFEEVDLLPRGSGLLNFGWSVYEGRLKRTTTVQLDPSGTLTWPVLTYGTHESGNCSIIGGYVYRGTLVPALKGRYVFGDYCSGRVWSVLIKSGRASGLRLEKPRLKGLTSFGVDGRGELYAVYGRTIAKFVR